MSKLDIKKMLEQAIKEIEIAHNNFGNKSAAHRAALQIMQFEKELHYGEVNSSSYLKKIQTIIEEHAVSIVDETKKH